MLQQTATRPLNVLLGASRLSLTSAAARALEEASSLRVVLGWQEGFDAQELLAGGACSPEAFGALYADAPDSDAFRFALEAPESLRPTPQLNAADPLGSLVARLADHGMEVLAVDLTLPEVRECGIVVVRVLVPELQPISFAHGVRYLASSRLYHAVMAMGFGERAESGVTTRPIPYA